MRRPAATATDGRVLPDANRWSTAAWALDEHAASVSDSDTEAGSSENSAKSDGMFATGPHEVELAVIGTRFDPQQVMELRHDWPGKHSTNDVLRRRLRRARLEPVVFSGGLAHHTPQTTRVIIHSRRLRGASPLVEERSDQADHVVLGCAVAVEPIGHHVGNNPGCRRPRRRLRQRGQGSR